MSTTKTILVRLRLAGVKDIVDRRIFGWLTATTRDGTVNEFRNAVTAPVVRAHALGEFHLGAMTFPPNMSLERRTQLIAAIAEGWRTGRNVDVVDEDGRPLMRGSLDASPDGAARWLEQYRRNQ